jgi:microcystin-dependent protein
LGTEFGGDGIHNFALPDLRPKDEHGNPIHINTGDMYNGKPYVPSYIAIQGMFPSWD